MARQTKRTTRVVTKLFDALRSGSAVGTACACAGIGRQTYYEWRERDPGFAAECDAAIEYGTDILEDVAFQRAMTQSDALMQFLLKARRPEKYRERNETIHKGDDEHPLAFNFFRDESKAAE